MVSPCRGGRPWKYGYSYCCAQVYYGNKLCCHIVKASQLHSSILASQLVASVKSQMGGQVLTWGEFRRVRKCCECTCCLVTSYKMYRQLPTASRSIHFTLLQHTVHSRKSQL